MTSITATDTVQHLLGSLTDITEIRDKQGKVLGYFTPAVECERQMYQRAKSGIDRAEIARREQSNEPGYTFEQVMDHLKSLETSQCGSP